MAGACGLGEGRGEFRNTSPCAKCEWVTVMILTLQLLNKIKYVNCRNSKINKDFESSGGRELNPQGVEKGYIDKFDKLRSIYNMKG